MEGLITEASRLVGMSAEDFDSLEEVKQPLSTSQTVATSINLTTARIPRNWDLRLKSIRRKCLLQQDLGR